MTRIIFVSSAFIWYHPENGGQMTVGETLTLLSGREVIIKRTLVSVENGVYFVCKLEEFEAAKRDGRNPVCIGFRKEYVLDPKNDRVKV
jgi:hypothetical protein